MRFLILVVSLVLAFSSMGLCEDEQIFSGPQVGEPLGSFESQLVFGDEAGETTEILKDSESPTLLIFVHKVTRPSIGLTRLLGNYAAKRTKDGLESHIVFLSRDPTETEALLNRARRALPKNVTPTIFPGGEDGPGAYGLNRKVTLTILVGNEGKVKANFALVQPSVQADALKIGAEIASALGEDDAPTADEMGINAARMNMRRQAAQKRANTKDREKTAEQDGIYRQMIAPVIRGRTDDDVEKAAKEVEEFAAENPWFRARVHKAANLIINGGKLENYGTEAAQAYLKKWSEEFKPEEADDEDAEAPKERAESDDAKAETESEK